MESCDKVFGNVDLLTLIFKYLDYGDQLRFAQVKEQWRNAYEFCSGNFNYSSLYIIYNAANDIIITGEMGKNARCLNEPQLIEHFLALYADRVHNLTLLFQSKYVHFVSPRKFSNLRCFTAYKIEFSRDIYDMCPPDLQELNLVDCLTDVNSIVEVLRRRMRNLKKLQIVFTNRKDKRETRNLITICQLPKLEFFKLKTYSRFAKVCLASSRNLKELDIRAWNMERFKKLPLQNLKILNLSLAEDTGNLFSLLTENCAALEILTLNNVRFENVTTCSLPSKVTHLSFIRCGGLTHSCLKQILTEYQIVKFRSRRTCYTGVFHDFKISSHIESLDIDFVEMTQFRSAYENNTQLRELIWKRFQVNNGTYDGSFNSTSNLQLLEMPQIPAAGSLSQLISLHSLILSPIIVQWKWNDIVHLLKHPTLYELSLLIGHFERPEKKTFIRLELNQPPVVMSLHTNITSLRLSPTCLRTWMKNWLKLFSKNMQLTLVCLPITSNELDFAKKLVNHKNFPRKLKTIDVCCVTIDCKRLRRNYECVKREYISDISLKIIFNYRDEHDGSRIFPEQERRDSIVLSWK